MKNEIIAHCKRHGHIILKDPDTGHCVEYIYDWISDTVRRKSEMSPEYRFKSELVRRLQNDVN